MVDSNATDLAVCVSFGIFVVRRNPYLNETERG